MIQLKRKEDCVGCNACLQICPRKCISLCWDEQGFNYPRVDIKRCIECGLCERVCPVLHQDIQTLPLKAYAAYNPKDSIRKESSSGGIFYLIAEKVIRDGGVVFGAKFDSDWSVIHSHTDNIDGIRLFQKSKYVQSKIDSSYRFVKEFLTNGRTVLFSGTPCQIAGLRKFLKKDYGNQLILVDTACHGVPSPMIWKSFLKEFTEREHCKVEDITNINFRDKRHGWETYGMSIRFKGKSSEKEWYSSVKDNLYMQGFLKNLYLRPSCYLCPTKCGKAHSDITLADFWGIRNNYPDLYSEQGVSLVLSNTAKGEALLNILDIKKCEVDIENALNGNPAIKKSSEKSKTYHTFWQFYTKSGLSSLPSLLHSMQPSVVRRSYRKIIKYITGILSNL